MKAKIGHLTYTPHYKNHAEGSIVKQEADGCLLIANVTPSACISQEQHDKNMRLIVDALNHIGVGVHLTKD